MKGSIKRLVAIGSIATVALLIMVGVAAADTVGTDFDTFNLGSVNGQGPGWKSGPTPYDQEVVDNSVAGAPASFGAKSLRMSNADATGEFSDQTYSKPTADPAGENVDNHVFDAQFSFTSTDVAQQPGLFLSVSPDSYEGSRMSYVGLDDQADGIHVNIYDSPLDVSPAGYTFRNTDAQVLLDQSTTHTIRFWIKLVPGENNDIVRIFIDGVDIGDKLGVCFTTWENYYRLSPEQTIPNNNTPPNLNSLQFRSGTSSPTPVTIPSLQGGGYLFDDVSTMTANGNGPGSR